MSGVVAADEERGRRRKESIDIDFDNDDDDITNSSNHHHQNIHSRQLASQTRDLENGFIDNNNNSNHHHQEEEDSVHSDDLEINAANAFDESDKERLLGEINSSRPKRTPRRKVTARQAARWLLDEGWEGVYRIWRTQRGLVWLVLMTSSTLIVRKLFRGSFPYPLFFMFILQTLCVYRLIVYSIHSAYVGFRKNRFQDEEWRFGIRAAETVLHIQRLLICSVISVIGLLLGTHALMIYPNFHVLALLPVFSYVCDSFLLHIASLVRLHPFQNLSTYLNFVCTLITGGACAAFIATDYRVEREPVKYALLGLLLESISRVLMMLYSNVQEQRRDSKSFYIFERFVYTVPQLIISGAIAFKNENTADAWHRLKSWNYFIDFWIFLPPTLLLLLFSSGLNNVYRGPIWEELTSVLEESKPHGRETVAPTLHATLLIIMISSFREQNLLNWFQAMAFGVLYIVAIGPVHVGYYPQRLYNTYARLRRRKPILVSWKSWRLLTYLVTSSLLVGILLSCSMVYWVDTIAYNRSVRKFINPAKPNIDYSYRPPRIRGMEVVVAHSKGHNYDALFHMLDVVRGSKRTMGLGPPFTIYTKDPDLTKKMDQTRKSQYKFEELKDIGGPAATYLKYIIDKWDTMPTQVLFLSTSKSGKFPIQWRDRIESHFAGQGFPVADAEPKTGFLSLGESQVCDCHSCKDSFGWEDTFGLIDSMWTAARPNQTTCDKALLTYSNNFFASSARIHGVKKDVWQLLYDGLTNPDINSWTHDKAKLPKMYKGELKKGRWAPDGVYGQADSLQTPLMGATMERLWGILLQCSTAEIAWNCPTLERNRRIGGEMADCGCIDELAPGFL